MCLSIYSGNGIIMNTGGMTKLKKDNSKTTNDINQIRHTSIKMDTHKLIQLKQELQKAGDPEKAKIYYRFFKTGKGEYGEGDVFLGITTPKNKEIAKKHLDLSLSDIEEMLNSKIHEHRSCVLTILVRKFQKANELEKKKIFELYLKNAKKINNWDLVDCSAPNIVGEYLLNRKNERKILYKLANSDNLWEKRISMLATYTFIRAHQFEDTINLSEILMNDKHDLMHKAVGWMLREMGKRDVKILEKFLDKHAHYMPRTMLRYSIEKFDETKRKYYLNKGK